ncbi:MAG: OmpA family protein [Anaerolineae bacterium]|nr:OmpA family protein [Phycisphaerae bacterium]
MRFSMLGSTIVLGLVAFFAGGCQNKLFDENVQLHNQNREIQQKLTESDMRLRSAPDPSQMATMQQELTARDQKIAELQAQLANPAPNTPAEESNLLKGIEVTRDDRAGTMTVNLPGDVLFSSGSAELKSSAKGTLDKITSAIKRDYPGKRVIVQGYTDTDPISKTKDKWQDNLDLSASRARAVAKYLTQQGVDSKNVGLQAYGETMAKGSKDRSRRVEIVIATR